MEGGTASNLFYGFRGSSHYLKSSHKDALKVEPKASCVRSRRKSRKHQRFLKYKEFLQQRGQGGTLRPETIQGEDSCSVTDNDSNCRLHMDELHTDCMDDQSEKLNKIKAMLCLLPTTVTSSSVHCASCDYDSGLSVSGSSPSTRPSSPCSWLKPGKCVAIDCEMVGTGPGRISELARCSIVNYRGDVVYDKYIKPELTITDYRTRWSGITKYHMKNAIPFTMAQKEILNILKDKRVIGHALNNDFKALRYYHPKEQTRDTSEIRLLSQMAALPSRPSLKSLAWCLLQKRIQVGKKGHSSVEDAQTCMELYKLVEDHIEQDLLSNKASVIIPEEVRALKNRHYMEDQYWPSDLTEDCK